MLGEENLLYKLKNKGNILPILIFFIAIAMAIIIFMAMGYAPFGNKMLAGMDANIQYLDFFSYLKNILLGKDSINYSYTNLLGGSSITLVAYYLCSPLNLLVFFFKNTQLPIFFSVLFAIKIALSATTMCIFLQNRFKNKLNEIIVVVLSISYAFMQYNMTQSSNIIWLDGVYMLPLMLLGVYQVVNGGKNLLLPIATGLTIMFNWYIGAINCLFSGVWFIFELMLTNSFWKSKIKQTVIFIISMLEGVFLSAFIFVPNIVAMRASSRSQFDWSLLTNTFRGSLTSIIQKYIIGGLSDSSNISFFCGSFVLIGFTCFFITNNISNRTKFLTFIMSIVMYLIFFWQPLYLVFSLFKEVDSYWCRYSYIGIFYLIFVAAIFYIEYKGENARWLFLIVAFVYSILVLYFNRQQLNWEVYATCIFTMCIALIVVMYYNVHSKRNIINYALFLIVAVELLVNAYPLLSLYSYSDATVFSKYEASQDKQIEGLKKYDSSDYRALQTETRNESNDEITANYNEGMAFNYWSISGYTSIESTTQLNLLNNLGYRNEQNRITIVNTPILGSDALLGVKYILSDYKINGLNKIKSLGKHNGKSVYENPYVLPLAFVAGVSGTKKVSSESTFDFQNEVYSNILNKRIDLYSSIPYSITKNVNSLIYTLQLPVGDFAIYGNIYWSANMDATLNLNNKKTIGYAKWLSPSVFYVPTTKNEKTAIVKLTASSLDVLKQEFYALNLKKLADASKEIQNMEVKANFEKNKIKSTVTTNKENQYLYLSIAKDSGWIITDNGKNVKSKSYANDLVAIPLSKGKNRIILKYKVVHQKLGIIVTILATIALIAYIYTVKKK